MDTWSADRCRRPLAEAPEALLLARLMIPISDSIRFDYKTYTSRLHSFTSLFPTDIHKIIREMQ